MTTKLLLIFLLCFSNFAFSQENEKDSIEVEKLSPAEIIVEEKAQEFEQIKLERLKRIRNELVTLQARVNESKKKLRSDNLDMVPRIQEESKLNSYETEYEKKRLLFIETATSINLNQEIKSQEKANFFQDLQDILAPALMSIKQISDRPRQIQTLNERREQVEKKYQEAQTAKKRLEKFLKNNDHKELKWKLKESLKVTEDLIQKLEIDREDIKFKIIKIESDQEPFITKFSSIILDFFKTKGLNLLLSLITFILVFWLFKTGKTKFISIILFRINKSENKELYQWIVRPIRVIYNVISTLFAFLLAILTLYALNDWVLVTLILFVIAALIWSSKQYFPQFLEQSKIVLNLGSIREDERVMFNGLPWQIKSLGYHCRLYNPVLSGGFLRVNTRDMMSLCSRRVVDSEPWFPTKTGDWIQLEKTIAQVTLQSPEQVIVKTLGGENIVYQANKFYEKEPKNLSNGFAVEFLFGLDYAHQAILFSEVIPTFKEAIDEYIPKSFPQLTESIIDFSIEFSQAGASSLDLRIFLKCKGTAASKKQALTRAIQSELVRVCTEKGYVIPFNQLTVHMQN